MSEIILYDGSDSDEMEHVTYTASKYTVETFSGPEIIIRLPNQELLDIINLSTMRCYSYTNPDQYSLKIINDGLRYVGESSVDYRDLSCGILSVAKFTKLQIWNAPSEDINLENITADELKVIVI
jgi:hypothetical protein